MIFDCIALIVSFIGSIIGGLLTYAGVRKTIKFETNNSKFLSKKNALPLLKIQQDTTYDYRNKYLKLDFIFTEESKSRIEKNITDTAHISFSIFNVGMRELYDLHIAEINSTYFHANFESAEICPILYANDKISINLFVYELGSYNNDKEENKYDLIGSPFNFKCYFKDCYDNWYYQIVSVLLFHALKQNCPENSRALSISIERANILSAPVEAERCNLPWIINPNKLIHL